MNIQQFAEKYRLRITRVPGDGSERGDPRIAGSVYARDGVNCDRQLYFDGGALCLMVIDGAPIARRTWETCGGKLWLSDISRDASGRRVQDAKITAIPIDNAAIAIRLARAKRIYVQSEAQRTATAIALEKLKEKRKGQIVTSRDAV
jgi:hypothetical protein